MEGETFYMMSTYTPQVWLEEHCEIKFWEDLEALVHREYHYENNIFLGGDLNGHVGRTSRGYEGSYGVYDLGEGNVEDKSILDFLLAHDFTIANTLFFGVVLSAYCTKEINCVIAGAGYYNTELHVIDGIPQLIFVRSSYTIEVGFYDFFYPFSHFKSLFLN